MKRFLILLLRILVVLLPLNSFAGGGNQEGWELRKLGRQLGVDLSKGILIRLEDSHGGFHGDGLTEAEIAVDSLDVKPQGVPGWHPLPLTEQAAKAVELCGAKETPEEGFYYLCDRHRESRDPYDDAQLHERYSWNFTVAVYDSENGRLYYYELDT